MRNFEERKEKTKEMKDIQSKLDAVVEYLQKNNINIVSVYDLQKFFRFALLSVNMIEFIISVNGEEPIEKILKGDKI